MIFQHSAPLATEITDDYDMEEEATEAVDKTFQEIGLNTVKHWSSHLKWERIDNE